MRKLIVAIMAVCFWATTACAFSPTRLEQPMFDKKTWSVTYMDHTYNYYKHLTGIAGYETIDESVGLLKMIFKDSDGNTANMIQILSMKEELDIVGFSFDIDSHRYAIEDSDCDGIFDDVKLYDDLVFPPDCFHPTKGLEDAFKI